MADESAHRWVMRAGRGSRRSRSSPRVADTFAPGSRTPSTRDLRRARKRALVLGSRRPDSNLGPLHYEATTSEARPSTRGHGRSPNPGKRWILLLRRMDARACAFPPSCTRFVPSGAAYLTPCCH